MLNIHLTRSEIKALLDGQTLEVSWNPTPEERASPFRVCMHDASADAGKPVHVKRRVGRSPIVRGRCAGCGFRMRLQNGGVLGKHTLRLNGVHVPCAGSGKRHADDYVRIEVVAQKVQLQVKTVAKWLDNPSTGIATGIDWIRNAGNYHNTIVHKDSVKPLTERILQYIQHAGTR